MDKLEKVERLREHANVSFEEAKAALEQANDDLLDAMVILERQGKVNAPESGTYSTSYEEQKQYLSVQEKVDAQNKAYSFGQTVKGIFLIIKDFVLHTTFLITREEKTVFTMPTWALVLILLFTFEAALPVMLIAMLFKVRYHFEGERHTAAANTILDKAGSFADGIDSEIQKNPEGK